MTRLQGEGSSGGSIERLCAAAGVSRASYYRQWASASPGREETALRDLVQRLALAERFYGYRRITELVRRQGFAVNRKRIARIMRQDNLLALRKKPAFRPATTDSRHAFTVWPNLARRLILTAVDQLWVADITYVRLDEAFVYLAVVLDGFSRKVVGWAMADHLRAELALEALDMALASRRPAPGLIHHSDRGVQYASGDYIGRLLDHDLQPSMSRPGCPWDNAMAESFMKTLKTEEVDGCDYRNLADARARIGQFINEVYNRQRLHSALRYLSPEEFEAQPIKLIHNPVDRVPRPTAATTTVAN